MPKLSVIVPVYRSYPRMVELLDSILAQTFTDFELILINDCTPDKESREYCNEIAAKDFRIRLFHLDKNRGIAGARNFGLEQVTGEFIHFSDADDYVAPTMYEDCIKELERSNADIVFTSHIARMVDDNKDIISSFSVHQKTFNVKDAFPFLFGDFVNFLIWNKIFRTNNIINNNIQFRYDVHYSDDSCFTIDYLYHSKMISLLSTPYYYWHKWSKTQSSSTPLELKALDILLKEFYKLLLHYDWDYKKYDVIRTFIYSCLYDILSRKDGSTMFKISVCKRLVKQYNIIELYKKIPSRINKLVFYSIEKQYPTWIIAIFYYIKLFQERKI